MVLTEPPETSNGSRVPEMGHGDHLGLTSNRHPLFLGSWLGSVLLLTNAPPVFGQLATLEPGSRVRITAPIYGIEQAVGTVQGTTEGTLTVEFKSLLAPQGATAWTVRRTNITDLEISIDQRRYGLKGLGIGFFSGILAGAAAGFLSAIGENDTFDFGDQLLPLARALGIAGGVSGLILGSMRQDDVWVPHSPVGDVTFVGPPRDKGALRLDVGFTLNF